MTGFTSHFREHAGIESIPEAPNELHNQAKVPSLFDRYKVSPLARRERVLLKHTCSKCQARRGSERRWRGRETLLVGLQPSDNLLPGGVFGEEEKKPQEHG